jgi:hypothetical protein
VTPDGQQFVVFKRNSPQARMIVVHDWLPEVRARMSLKP